MIQTKYHILIVGAGLGGLCLAHGLKKAGLSVAVFERDGSLHTRGQGYRLTIDPEGSRALKACLPADQYNLMVATSGVLGDRFTFYDDQRRIIRQIPFPHGADADDTQVSKQVDRLTLRQILLAGLLGQVHFGRTFTHFEQTDEVVTALFKDGYRASGDLLVGADGVNSRVARQLLPHAAVTDTGIRAIYGRTPLMINGDSRLPEDMVGSGVVALGSRRALFLTAMRFRERPDRASRRLAPNVELAAREDYIMWSVSFPQSTYAPPERGAAGVELHKIAKDLIRNFHPDFSLIVNDADPTDTILVPIRSAAAVAPWATGNVTLLGDAIHCMPPTGAHGANTALRDAATLARHLGSALLDGAQLLSAVSAYEAEMLHYGFDAVRDAASNMQNMMQTIRSN